MRYSIIGYLVGEGFKNVIKNKKSTASSLAIMCMVMLVFGLFFIIGQNVNYIMNNVESAQAVQVFLKKDVSEEESKNIGEKIKKINGVNKVQYVSVEDAYNEAKTTLVEDPTLLTGYEDIFPSSFIITFTDLSLKDDVQAQILKIKNVDEIKSSDKTMETLMNITRVVRIITGVILIILIFVSIFIISNTIKLSVYSRRKEISIMKYVGATNNFIRWPFIVEGILIGIIAGLISILIVGLSYNLILNQIIQTDIVKTLGLSFVNFSSMFSLIIIVYMILGSGIGIIGSSMSMRKYLDV